MDTSVTGSPKHAAENKRFPRSGAALGRDGLSDSFRTLLGFPTQTQGFGKRWGCKQIRGQLRKKAFLLRFLNFPGALRRIFSPLFFVGKECPEKSSRRIPGKILQNLHNKIPRHSFCKGAGPVISADPLWRGKQGRFVIFRFPLFCSVWGSQITQMLGKTARKVSLSHPFLRTPKASKN